MVWNGKESIAEQVFRLLLCLSAGDSRADGRQGPGARHIDTDPSPALSGQHQPAPGEPLCSEPRPAAGPVEDRCSAKGKGGTHGRKE
eukprot:scaffold327990_cov38-Prasinocladus_malaysianus.AAC.1